ncbi:MAG: hypothetical protein BAJATHORv1_30485 [Candidatus Thorarchaeota archaeon]|nr:MAG: hypothetical protein BAJATHORv1_30485 [Candidatus Thorarchaeota archaeon]
MSCETCTTIIRYGKRVPSGKRVCIDCWKEDNEKTESNEEEP